MKIKNLNSIWLSVYIDHSNHDYIFKRKYRLIITNFDLTFMNFKIKL